jgi:hypothetical protein
MDIETEHFDIVLADLVADVLGVVFGQVIVFQGQVLALAGCAGIG